MPKQNTTSQIGEAPNAEQRGERRRERERQRKRDARRRQTPDQRERERVRKREERMRQTSEQREREQARERARVRKKLYPFMAIDGEGGGTDHLGRQNYLLMVASGETPDDERILHRDGKHLPVKDCLEFLLSLPADSILVGYGFGYDSTQILRGIKPPTLRQILNPRQGKNGPYSTYWGDYAIGYLQGQYLRIARVDRSGDKPSIIKGSCRTVYETLGFFQCAFVKAIDRWGIGTEEERAEIAANKARRNEFSQLTEGIIEYSKSECRALASLMTEFRKVCIEVGITPRQWSGAGSLAAALLEQHCIPKRPLTVKEIAARAELKPTKKSRPSPPRRPERDREFELAAGRAYFGGRFEVSRLGLIRETVYEYDLNSAYPAAMLDLPCPLHTRWKHLPRTRRLPAGGLYLAKVSFSHPDGSWCGFPFRQAGGLFWPFQGTGWYWSPEIEAARQHLHADVVVHDLWVAKCDCHCRPFDWVRELYAERRRLGSDTRGHLLKLALNSLYGKTAQRSGRGPYHDPVAAGLITAITRARLIEAIAQAPEAVLMVATDAVFSTRPLVLDRGRGLGQWEEKSWQDLFIAQPGVYWSPTKLQESIKSRGAPRSIIGDAAPRFLHVFSEWCELIRAPAARDTVLKERLIPSVPVSVRVFYGCRYAVLARGKPWLAGKWEDVARHETFEWGTKRDPRRIVLGDGYIETFPLALSILAESEGAKGANFDRLIEVSEKNDTPQEVDENTLLEAMPDHIDFLPDE